MQSYYAEFKRKYDAVFDSNGRIKPCGRQHCKDLILLCQRISADATGFGNAETGVMNVSAIKALASDIL